MKLSIRFGLETAPYVVEWNGDIKDFHHFFSYDGFFWEWFMYDEDDTGGADYELVYGKISEAAIPIDLNAKRFPTPDFRTMFGFVDNRGKVCECGAVATHGQSTGHSSWCPLWSKP